MDQIRAADSKPSQRRHINFVVAGVAWPGGVVALLAHSGAFNEQAAQVTARYGQHPSTVGLAFATWAFLLFWPVVLTAVPGLICVVTRRSLSVWSKLFFGLSAVLSSIMWPLWFF
jgi:hypothetical protein